MESTEEGSSKKSFLQSFLYKPCFKPKTEEKLMKFLNSNKTQLFITVMIFFALFGDDVRLAACPKSSDSTFQVITIICWLVFGAELTINFVCLSEWRFGKQVGGWMCVGGWGICAY
jgi:hypothetical protein